MFKWFKKNAYASNVRLILKNAGYNEKTVIILLFGSLQLFTKWAGILAERGATAAGAADHVIEYLRTSSRYNGECVLDMTVDQPMLSWSTPGPATYLIDNGWIEDV